ncbi:MAG: sigma-54 dependent transcriptional regulator [Gemmatimonadetes bacterium]|nr:sigma-54 dependent transcriptional regulator [Gemmatimonadota bacterium]
MGARILIVDDDENTLDVFETKLEHSGHDVDTATSAEEALGKLKKVDPAVVITDLRMPGMSGLELLEKVKEHMEHVDVIVVTGHEDMNTAVAAMKAGAFDYIVKPVDLKQVASLVERCLREQELNRQAAEIQAAKDEEEDEEENAANAVVGRDPRMIDIYKMIGVLARNRATVLIRGETGTGKEMVARAIHANSAHAEEPFIAVNCTALTDTLLESELFGHVKGAFTGAVSGRKGYFELASSGTVFLDEIGDTSPEFQTKLLRVLQERKFYPVGGEEPRTTEARVIAATHQPVEQLVEDGEFREDLYFRLKVVEITVPTLRERRDDIPLLAESLLARIRQETHQIVRHISEPAMKKLMAYDWPGNVRELENALTRAAILARGTGIGPEHLSLGVDYPGRGAKSFGAAAPKDADEEPEETGAEEAAGAPGPDEDLSLDDVISEHIQRVLRRTDGNKSETARLLGISRSRLQRYVDKFELEVPT